MPDIVERLRRLGSGCVGTISDEHCPLLNEAADMLELFFCQVTMYSPKMDGQHRYRIRGGGWPTQYMVGPNAEEAVKAAIQEVKRSKQELSNE